MRNTFNDLLWIAGLIAYLVISGLVHREIGGGRVQVSAKLLVIPVSAIFLAWSGRVLSARRISLGALVPFAIVASLAVGVYFAGAAVYVPHLFSSYATRYGVIGAVLAMISALFGFMLFVVASAALGREVFDELGRIRARERPPDDEVRREWDAFIREARARWQTLRDQVDRIRGRQPRRAATVQASAEMPYRSGGSRTRRRSPRRPRALGSASRRITTHPDGGAVGIDRVAAVGTSIKKNLIGADSTITTAAATTA